MWAISGVQNMSGPDPRSREISTDKIFVNMQIWTEYVKKHIGLPKYKIVRKNE